MSVRRPVGVGMGLDQDIGRHQDDAAMADAALGDHVLGEVLHLVGLAAQDGHLHAAVVVEVGVHRGERQLVVVMESVGEPLGELPRVVVVDVDQGGDAVALLVDGLGGLPDAGAGEVADRLGAVLVTAGEDDAVAGR